MPKTNNLLFETDEQTDFIERKAQDMIRAMGTSFYKGDQNHLKKGTAIIAEEDNEDSGLEEKSSSSDNSNNEWQHIPDSYPTHAVHNNLIPIKLNALKGDTSLLILFEVI